MLFLVKPTWITWSNYFEFYDICDGIVSNLYTKLWLIVQNVFIHNFLKSSTLGAQVYSGLPSEGCAHKISLYQIMKSNE